MEKVLLSIEKGVATITINSPENYNALDDRIVGELAETTREIDKRGDVRVVLLRGSGKAFCSGGDIVRFHELGEGIHDFITSLAPPVQQLVQWMHQTPAIIVASVQGPVAGGGVGIMLAADIIIAAESATVVVAYAQLGTSPDAGASYFMARTLGYRKALELYLLSERLSGKQAAEIGLINFAVPDNQLAAKTQEIMERLAAGPAQAVGAAKRLFRQAVDTGLHQHLDDELRLFADNTRHPDFGEGVRAFLEKRAPRFGNA